MSIAHLSLLGIGGLLMAVPVLLHFLMKPKPVLMPFPAMRFLQEKSVTARSKMRLRHLLLLLLRCLLIGLLAAAFAGPTVASADFGNWITLGGVGLTTLLVGAIAATAYFRDQPNQIVVWILGGITLLLASYCAWAAGQIFSQSSSAKLIGQSGAPVAAIVVIDNSPTMEYRFENQTRLEKSAEVAQWLVGQFPSDSQVCVVALDRDTPFFSVDTSAAAKRLSKIDVIYNAETVTAALARAYPLFDEVELERKEIYIFTDLTTKSWAATRSEAALKRLADDESVSTFVIDVGVESPINTALQPLELSETVISQSGRLTVTAGVTQTGGSGGSDRSQTSVAFEILKQDEVKPVVRDGKTVFPDQPMNEQTKTVTLPPTGPGETNGAVVDFMFEEPLAVGTWQGSVKIVGTDALPADNKRSFTFEVSPPNEALVIHGDDVSPANLISSIAPQEAVQRGAARFDCTVTAQSDFNSESKLTPFSIVYLLDPGPLSQRDWLKLKGFTEAGGRVAIFLGHNAVYKGAPHPSFLTAEATDMLCGRLLFPFRSIEGDVYLSPDKFDHPMLKRFRGIESTVPWSKHPVYYHWGIEQDPSWERYPTEVVARYGNREPAILERNIGAGKTVVMTTPISEPANAADRDIWNELFLGLPWPTYTLVVDMSTWLADTAGRSLNVGVGQNAVLSNDLSVFPESYRVFSPIADKSPTPVTTVDGKLTYRFVDAPGNYFLKPIQQGFVGNRGFSATVDSKQTNLTRTDAETLDLTFGIGNYQLARGKDEIQLQQGTARRGQEFFPLIMLMTLIVMGVEHLLSNRFYKG